MIKPRTSAGLPLLVAACWIVWITRWLWFTAAIWLYVWFVVARELWPLFLLWFALKYSWHHWIGPTLATIPDPPPIGCQDTHTWFEAWMFGGVCK